MPFRLKKQESVNQGLRRVFAEQYMQAITQLRKRGEQRQEGIHEARKNFKKIRALLRLLRRDMPEVYAVENKRLRDLSALLSPYRDADAMLETMQKLQQSLPGLIPDGMLKAATTTLRMTRDQLLEREPGYNSIADRVIRELIVTRDNLGAWPLPKEGDHLRSLLSKTQKRARKAAHAARHSDEVEAFHNWRKESKDLQYQAQLLQNTKAALPTPLREQLKALTESLGDHHDLCVFEELLRRPEVFNDRQHAQHVADVVAQRRHQLEQETRRIGKKMFS